VRRKNLGFEPARWSAMIVKYERTVRVADLKVSQ
jgi:hypothetical protein